MKNEQILKKAIAKAEKNGWDLRKATGLSFDSFFDVYQDEYMAIIFSHDFAKTFWKGRPEVFTRLWVGDFPIKDEKEEARWVAETGRMKAWQLHLQQMVLEKNPTKYLERFL